MLQKLGFLLLITCTFFFNTQATEIKTYIVQLTSLQNQPHDIQEWYTSFLSKAASRSNDKFKPEMVFTYRHVITGFAAKMSADQAKVMESLPGVLSVTTERLYQLQTTRSPYFLGLHQNTGLWKDSNYGKGVIVGLMDTGFTPGHPSFDDHGLPPPPSAWKGKCNVAGCNNKVIGVRNFTIEERSPIDKDGHGTHTASTAAGNFVENANVFGLGNGIASGMAPLAHLAIYKVCDTSREFCRDSAVLAGIDAAIDDGVHVLSISIGSDDAPIPNFKDDVLAVATFSAIQKGIFVSCSAGNKGPDNATLSNQAPWVLTVGASTTDRRFRTSVLLGNKKVLHGESLYQPKDADHKLRPLVYPRKDDTGDERSAFCLSGSLDHIDVKGKVVLCDEGFADYAKKGKVVKEAGGAAMIIANYWDESIVAEANVILASNVGYKEGVEIKKYLNSTSSPVAAILCGGTVVGLKSDPQMASFSSRGPNVASPGILKPDITGPGVDILAAWPKAVDNQTRTKATFNIIRGTSMSCPHLAGVAALLKSAHPEWSPAAIKSALMTTAGQYNRNATAIVDESSHPADMFAIGAGHVNPQRAHNPGFVFDIQPDDYIPYLCGLGYPPEDVHKIVKKNVTCSKSIKEAELNYPSFSVSLKRGDHKKYRRTVTNVGPAHSCYRIRDISVPKGVNVKVVDDVISFTSVQQKRRYEVTFSRDDNDTTKGPYGQGHMTWVSDTGRCTVRTPFSFKFECSY